MLADSWFSYCTKTLSRGQIDCSAIQQAIKDSVGGNLGRRAGLICQRLTDCGQVSRPALHGHQLDLSDLAC